LKVEGLVVKEAIVGEGPTMKRMMARARGSGSRILKRSSHIRIVLTDEIKIETPETRKAAQKAAKKKAGVAKAEGGAAAAETKEQKPKRAKKGKK
jgi:large subunit ribosomal protein L22